MIATIDKKVATTDKAIAIISVYPQTNKKTRITQIITNQISVISVQKESACGFKVNNEY